MLKNTDETYGLMAQLLHWTVALLILLMFPLGLYMHELPAGSEQEVAEKIWLYSLHKTIGVTALALALMRICWAISQPHPRLLNEENRLESLAALTGALAALWLHYCHAANRLAAPCGDRRFCTDLVAIWSGPADGTQKQWRCRLLWFCTFRGWRFDGRFPVSAYWWRG